MDPLNPGSAPRSLAPIAEIASLAPEALAARLTALADDLRLAYAANTQRAWRASWRVWSAFCDDTQQPVLPATPVSLRAFLMARIATGKKRSTLELNLWTLELVHQLVGLAWPLHTVEGRLMWRGIRRTHLTARQKQKRGLSIDQIERMLARLDPQVAIDVRDAALICVGYETGLRRSNVVALMMEHISWKPNGTTGVLVDRSKTDQEGEGRVKTLSGKTTERLQAWVALAGIVEGPLFRSVPRSRKPDRFANALSDRDVARIYKRRAAVVGIEADEIAGHSTRIGAAQDLSAAGYSGAAIMQEIGWQSERSLFRYTEHLEAERGAMAQFLRRRSSTS